MEYINKSLVPYIENQMLSDQYKLTECIGNVQKSNTYSAFDVKNNNKKVVIKILPFRSVNKWKEYDLFVRESDTLKNLNHPAIPKYLDFFKLEKDDNDIVFCLVQEFVEGINLEQKIKSGWRINEKIAFTFSKAFLHILKYLQSFSPPVIHRDINPRNILINADNHLFLVDFGAVQAASLHDHIGTQTIIGTAGYMPMEQIMGRSCKATDLFAFGITLIFLLTHTDPINLPVKNMKIDYSSVIEMSDKITAFLDKLADPDVSERFRDADEALKFLDSWKMPDKTKIQEEKDNTYPEEEKEKVIDLEWEYYKNDFIEHLKKHYSDLYDE